MQTHVCKIVEIEAGGLFYSLTEKELGTVTDLTITGTINARDFYIMNRLMDKLLNLNIKEASIVKYTGKDATNYGRKTTYPANCIPEKAFYNAYFELQSIELPSTLLSIGKYAFNSCNELKFIELPDTLISIGERAFYSCERLKSIELPAAFTILAEEAFGNCERLQSIKLPATLTEIGKGAFAGCAKLMEVYNYMATPINIGLSYVFNSNILPECTLYVPEDSIDVYNNSLVWKDFGTIEEIVL